MPAATIRTGLIDPRGRPARAGAAPASADPRAPRNPARAVGPGRTAGDPRSERTLSAYRPARGAPVRAIKYVISIPKASPFAPVTRNPEDLGLGAKPDPWAEPEPTNRNQSSEPFWTLPCILDLTVLLCWPCRLELNDTPLSAPYE